MNWRKATGLVALWMMTVPLISAPGVADHVNFTQAPGEGGESYEASATAHVDCDQNKSGDWEVVVADYSASADAPDLAPNGYTRAEGDDDDNNPNNILAHKKEEKNLFPFDVSVADAIGEAQEAAFGQTWGVWAEAEYDSDTVQRTVLPDSDSDDCR